MSEAFLPPADERELDELAEVLQLALGFPLRSERDFTKWFEPGWWRCVRRDGRIVAVLAMPGVGQFFGGRSVPMTAITAVGVLPEYRGLGLGSALLRSVIREMAEARMPLSGLYPATLPVYRGAGYEIAGQLTRYRISTADLAIGDRTLPVERFEIDDAEIRALYREQVRTLDGHLDRERWLWSRILEQRADVVQRYLVREGGRVTGYVVFTVDKSKGLLDWVLRVRELLASTPAALRRLVTLLGDHRSVATDVDLPLSPSALVQLPIADLREQNSLTEGWMLRLVDLPAAIAGRGYPPGLRAHVGLEVADDLLPGNQGTFTLEIADGAGELRRGGSAEVRLDIRALTQLYSGHVAPALLRAAGRLSGETDSAARLAACFAGPPPWMPEIF